MCSTMRARFFKVRGPLNVARPVQGWPVIVQAGASDAGRQLAAETAEMVFGAGGPIEAAREFYADVKGRMVKIGRNPDHLKILPGALVIVGATKEEARAKKRLVDSLVHPDTRAGLALGLARRRCLEIRAGRAVAGNSRDECQQIRARAGDRPCPAAESDSAAVGAAGRELWRQ